MIIENASNMSQHFKKIFKDEVYKAIEENQEIFTPEVMKKFKIYSLTSASIFANKLLLGKRHTVRYGPNQINDVFDKFLERDLCVPFRAMVNFGPDENGRVKIYHLLLIINIDELTYGILSNLYRLDTYMEKIKYDARHEVGHLIDYLINMNGCPFDDVVRRDIEEDRLKDEYYKWKINEENNFDENGSDEDWSKLQKEMSERYFRLPAEERADLYGGVDRQKCFEMMESTAKNSPTIRIELLG